MKPLHIDSFIYGLYRLSAVVPEKWLFSQYRPERPNAIMCHVHHFTFNAFAENTYILHDNSHEAIIIDPGCQDPWEQDRVSKYLQDNALVPKYILLTHGHIDHVLGLAWCKSKFSLKAAIHPEDDATFRAVSVIAPNYGYPKYEAGTIDDSLAEGQVFKFGNTELEVIHVPGHSPGHVAFLCKADSFIIGGDVLFRGSIGRWDFPGGSKEVLINSIRKKLYTLPEKLGHDVKVYPGHGPETTIKFEMANNPYVKA
ncbi:MAG: MBL fold metallo-hydrolase [Bacteroidota bacterium]